jgi:hypothetical protein
MRGRAREETSGEAMRTEAEIKLAIDHFTESCECHRRAGDPELILLAAVALDILRWVAGAPSTFEHGVMEPCRMIDRARRQ